MATNDTFESGVLWQTGDLVTAELLKDTVENATPKKALVDGLGLIQSVQPSVDTMMIKDDSNNDLKKITVADFLTSGITTSNIEPNDVKVGGNITPSQASDANGQIQPNVVISLPSPVQLGISGVYSCASGVVSVIPLTPVNLKPNDLINVNITGGDAAITGQFVTKQGTNSTGIFYDSRNPNIANNSGNCTVDILSCLKVDQLGNGTNPSPVVCGDTYVRENLQVLGNSEVLGTSNFRSDVTFSGTSVYGISQISDDLISPVVFNLTVNTNDANIWKTCYQSPQLTKTNKEIWVIEVDCGIYWYMHNATNFYNGLNYHRITRSGSATNLAWIQKGTSLLNAGMHDHLSFRAVIPANVTFTNEILKYEAYYRWTGAANAVAVMHIGYSGFQQDVCNRSFRIYKYIKP